MPSSRSRTYRRAVLRWAPSRSLDYSPSLVRRVISPQRMNHRSVPEVSRNCLTRLPRGAHVRHTRTRNRHEGPAPARACGRPAPKHPFASIGCSGDRRCSTSHSGLAFLAMAPRCGGARMTTSIDQGTVPGIVRDVEVSEPLAVQPAFGFGLWLASF